jgi:hypothetical protein
VSTWRTKTWPPKPLLQILAPVISITQNCSPGKGSAISKSRDSSIHHRQLPNCASTQTLGSLVPFHSYRPWKGLASPTFAGHQRPCEELLLLAQQHCSPGIYSRIQTPWPAWPPNLPSPTVPGSQLSGPEHQTVPSGLGASNQMASPFSGPRRRPPCLRTQPATPLLLLFKQGPCPRPPAPGRPSPRPIPAVSSLSPSLSRFPPTAPGAPSPARPEPKSAWSPRPSQPSAQALPITSAPPACPCSPLGAPPDPPPALCRASSGLAPRAWRATLERQNRLAPIARPQLSRCTAHQASGPGKEEGVGPAEAT